MTVNMNGSLENALSSLIVPSSTEEKLNVYAKSLSLLLLYSIKLTKSTDLTMTGKIYALELFISGIENLQKSIVQLLESVKQMEQQKVPSG